MHIFLPTVHPEFDQFFRDPIRFRRSNVDDLARLCKILNASFELMYVQVQGLLQRVNDFKNSENLVHISQSLTRFGKFIVPGVDENTLFSTRQEFDNSVKSFTADLIAQYPPKLKKKQLDEIYSHILDICQNVYSKNQKIASLQP